MESVKSHSPLLQSLRALIWPEIKRQKGRYSLYLLVILLSSAASLLPPQLYLMFSTMITGDAVEQLPSLRQFVLFGTFIAFAMFFSQSILVVCEEWICLHTEGNLRKRFMQHMHKVPLEFFDGTQRGDWLTRMSEDIRVVEQFVALKVPQQLYHLLVMIGISALLFSQNALVAITLLLTTAVIAAYNAVLQQRVNPKLDHLRDLHGQVFQGFLENYEGLKTIRSFGAESFTQRKFDSRVQDIINKGMRVVRLIAMLIGSNAFAVNFLTMAILGLVVVLIRNQGLAIGAALTYPFYIGIFYTSAFALIRGIHDWSEFQIHGRRLLEIVDATANDAEQQKAVVLPPETHWSSLKIKNLVLGYTGFASLTEPFDFALNKGELTVLTGPSGSGKSTLLEVLSGLRLLQAKTVWAHSAEKSEEISARISHGGTLPVALATYAEQRCFLCEGTLRSNITLSLDDQPNDEKIWAALAQVNLKDFVESKGGLNFMIEDAGSNLSEGQKQRIGLARAFLNPRPILLLDEPFAALDPDSIRTICQSLNTISEQRCTLLVTHIVPDELNVTRSVDFSDFCCRMGACADAPFGFSTLSAV